MVRFKIEETKVSARVRVTAKRPLEELMQNWRAWFKAVARSYAKGLESRVTEEDLEQECWIVFLELLKQYDPESDDFKRMLKCGVVNQCKDLVRHHKQQMRDVRREVSPVVTNEEGEAVHIVEMVPQYREFDAEDLPRMKEFALAIMDRLSPGGRRLFVQVIKPSKKLRDAYLKYVRSRKFPRRQIPSRLYADVLNVSVEEIEAQLEEIHVAAEAVRCESTVQ